MTYNICVGKGRRWSGFKHKSTGPLIWWL